MAVGFALATAFQAVDAAQTRSSTDAIVFPNSGSPDVQADFLRGVAALHNFEYEEANEAFLVAQALDRDFALAYWGEAMTYHQTLWGHEDLDAGRRVLARLGPTAEARARQAPTPREKAWLGAIEILFGEGTEEDRRRRYADAMGRLYQDDPTDNEAAAFYALALLGTVSRSLIGMEGTGAQTGLAGSETQVRVAEILNGVLRSQPSHPGALHYLLHDYDDPAHAHLGLEAARVYARVAPESSHALHMPAHIFVQLGMWADAEATDRAAYAASEAWVARKGLPPAMRSYHALSWRQYELLQLGRYQDAWATIGVIEPVVKATGDLTLLSDLSSMRSRYVIETRRWELMANERNFGNVNELCAVGFASARSGNVGLAELARQALSERSRSPQQGDLRPAIAVMERQVAAMIELAQGRRDAALDILQAASAAELKLPPPLGLPIPVKPAPELLGEVLLEAGRPAEAVEAFRQALARNANRSLSVLGLARALSATGEDAEARKQYAQLLVNYEHADADLADLAEVRAGAAGQLPPAQVGLVDSLSIGPVPGAAVAGLVALAAVGLVAVRYRGRTSPPKAAAPRAERRRRQKARR